MQLNRSSDHALRMLVMLAEKTGDSITIISASKFSQSLSVSPRYIMRIASVLRDSGFIGVGAGPRGGYFLEIDAQKLKMFDVITAMEGPIIISKCLTEKPCHPSGHCFLHTTYSNLQRMTVDYLRSVSIADIAANRVPDYSHIPIE